MKYKDTANKWMIIKWKWTAIRCLTLYADDLVIIVKNEIVMFHDMLNIVGEYGCDFNF